MANRMDKVTQAAAESVLAQDEGFKELVTASAKKALLIMLENMEAGSPEQRLNAAKGFMPVFAKVLTDQGGDDDASKIHAQTRQIVGSMLKPKVKLQVVEDEDVA